MNGILSLLTSCLALSLGACATFDVQLVSIAPASIVPARILPALSEVGRPIAFVATVTTDEPLSGASIQDWVKPCNPPVARAESLLNAPTIWSAGPFNREWSRPDAVRPHERQADGRYPYYIIIGRELHGQPGDSPASLSSLPRVTMLDNVLEGASVCIFFVSIDMWRAPRYTNVVPIDRSQLQGILEPPGVTP